MIVIGVLVALGADGWRADREDRVRVSEALVGIEGELVQDSGSMAIERAQLGRQVSAATRIIELSQYPQDISQDSLSILLEIVGRSGPLVLTDGSYQSLRASRGLDVIPEVELRRRLVDYYEGSVGNLGDIRRITVESVVVDNFLPILHRRTMPWLDQNSPSFDGNARPRVRLVIPVGEALADPELMSGVAGTMEYLRYYTAVMDQALASNARLLDLVRDHLHQ